MNSEISLETLGQLYLLQNTLHVANNETQMAEMICAALLDLPGIEAAGLYLDGHQVSYAQHHSGDKSVWPDTLPLEEEQAEKLPGVTTLGLQTVNSRYGTLVLQVTAPEQFQLYQPHLENTANVFALIIENRQQAAWLEASNRILEEEVRKQTAQLSLNEQRLSIAMKGASCGLWDYQFNKEELYFNSSYFTMAGYEPDEFPHEYNEWKKRVHPDDVEEAEKRVLQFFSEKIEPFSMEFRFRTKSGNWLWILSKGEFSEWDENNEPTRVTGLHIDITSQKEIEKEIEMHRNNLHELVEEKTEQLQRTMKLMVGREVRMSELKRMITKLQKQLIAENITPVVDESFGD